MEVEQQEGMPTKWVLYLFGIFVGCNILDSAIGFNCFTVKAIHALGLKFHLISTLMFFAAVWYTLRKYDYRVVFGDSIYRLSSIMIFGILFFTLILGVGVSLGVVDCVLDTAIWLTSTTLMQSKTTVSYVAAPIYSTDDGGCKSFQYTFVNPLLQRDTTICDKDDSLSGTKVGDTLLISQKLGSVGARVISVLHIS